MKSYIKCVLLLAVAVVTLSQEKVQGTSASPLQVQCGKRPIQSHRPHKRIIGGKNAGPWPWQAMIILKKNGTRSFTCTGTLISDQWVLTAAHCLTWMESVHKQDFQVVLGDRDFNITEGTEKYFNISDFRIHQNYSAPLDNDNDIGMVELARKVSITADIQPACLPKKNSRLAVGTMCYATGWGYTKEYHPNVTRENSRILQEAILPIVDHDICIKAMSSSGKEIFRENTTVCAGGSAENTTNGCEGDSGGPLSCEDQGRYFVQGVVSGGTGSCQAANGTYSRFMRVSSFIDWIETQMTSPSPTFPYCKDNHWFCCGYSTRKLDSDGDTHCQYDPGFMKSYCPISCKDPKCFPGLSKKKKTNSK